MRKERSAIADDINFNQKIKSGIVIKWSIKEKLKDIERLGIKELGEERKLEAGLKKGTKEVGEEIIKLVIRLLRKMIDSYN